MSLAWRRRFTSRDKDRATTGARGPWGSETFYYDGVGNRIEHRATPPGGSQTIATLGYPATSNRVTQITQNASLALRCRFTLGVKDAERSERGCVRLAEPVPAKAGNAAGNITSDNRLGSAYAYTYNHANRLKTVSYEGNLSLLCAADSRRTPRGVRRSGRGAPTPTTACTS